MAGKQKDGFQELKTQSDGTTLRRTTSQLENGTGFFKKTGVLYLFKLLFQKRKGQTADTAPHWNIPLNPPPLTLSGVQRRFTGRQAAPGYETVLSLSILVSISLSQSFIRVILITEPVCYHSTCLGTTQLKIHGRSFCN